MSDNITPTELGDGWPVAAPEEQGVDVTIIRARPQIIESTFDRVRYRSTTKCEYHILCG